MNNKNPSYPVMMAKAYFFCLLVFAAMFVLAGRLTYWQGWVFCGTYLLLILIVPIKFADRKDLLQERLKPGPGVKWWDKIFFRLYLFLILCLFGTSALDAGRFNWSPQLPVITYVAGYAIMLPSYFFILWAMWVNNFFSSRVRIQSDRGQYVVQDGPYRFVRHPGYLGFIPWMITLPVVLGSLWGLIPAGLSVIAVIIKTDLEDKILQKELPGYADYANKVRFRLFHGIW